MQFILYLLLFLLPFASKAQTYQQKIDLYRSEIKSKFEKDTFGPLREENIGYIDYYSANENFVVQAEVEILFGEKPFRMPTYDGTSNEYKRYALLHFEILGEKYTLTAYQSAAIFQYPQYKDYL